MLLMQNLIFQISFSFKAFSMTDHFSYPVRLGGTCQYFYFQPNGRREMALMQLRKSIQ